MNKLSLIFGVSALITAGIATHEWTARRRTEATIATIRHERDRLSEELRGATQRATEATERANQIKLQNTSLKEDFDRLFSQNNLAALRLSIGAQTRARFSAPKVRTHIQTTPRRVASVKTLETTYQVLYRQLNWSAEQILQFKRLVKADVDRFAELDELAKDRRMSPMDPAMLSLYDRADTDFRTRAVELFGADAVPAIQHFSETLFLRDFPVQVAAELFYTNTPLTETQANQLVEIMWKNMRDGSGQADIQFANSEAIIAEAQRILVPTQMDVWRDAIDHLVKTSFRSIRPMPKR